MSRRHQGLSLISRAGTPTRGAIILGLSAFSLLAEPARAEQPAQGAAPTQPSAPADGSVIATAEAYASAAYDAYVRKDYAQAVALYERVLSVTPNAALVLYNIARIYDVGLHSRGLAIDYYHRFIAAPGAPPAYILIARARMADLEIAERAAVNQTLATDAAQQSGPDEPGALAPISAAGAELPPPAATLEPVPTGAGLDTRLPPTPERNSWTSREVAAVAVGGAGIASVGLGVGFLLSARAKSEVWKRDCDGNDCSTQRAVDAAESASKQVAIGTAGLFAGGALMALGGVLWFVDFSGATPADASAVSSSSSWSLAPTVSASEISAAFSTRF